MAKVKLGIDCIGVGAGVFIVNDDREVLLMLRSKNSKNEKGLWNKVGGATEFGEKVADSLRREAKEELGVEITDPKYLSFTDHILPDEGQHWIGFNYFAKIKSGVPAIMEPDKCDEIRWFKFEEVPANLAMPTKESLSLMIDYYDKK